MRFVKVNVMTIPKKFDPSWIMYLILVDGILARNPSIEKTKPTERFFEMVNKHVADYVTEGAEPPQQIASAILNIADDVISGRQVTVRAGDYISLMEFARANKHI